MLTPPPTIVQLESIEPRSERSVWRFTLGAGTGQAAGLGLLALKR
jgi:hypothetical protein